MLKPYIFLASGYNDFYPFFLPLYYLCSFETDSFVSDFLLDDILTKSKPLFLETYFYFLRILTTFDCELKNYIYFAGN